MIAKNDGLLRGNGPSTMLVRRTQVSPIGSRPVQPSFTKTYLLYGVKNRRDAIIALVQQQHGVEPFVGPFVAHMKEVGKKALDAFSKITMHLLEYNIHLTFVTSNFVPSEFDYTIEALAAEPDFRIKRARTFLEWLTGPSPR